jgi:aminocarboxymuconate-semialdehyde decarboxylase
VTPQADTRFDVHTHVVPPQLPLVPRVTAARDPRWAELHRSPGRPQRADVLVAGRLFRTIRDVAFDLDARREEMAAQHVGGQLLSAMPELFAAWAPGTDARDHCRAFNAWLADEVASAADVFVGLGIVPVQAPDLMVEVLAEAHTLGLAGVEIPCSGPDAPLHDRRYEEFFALAEELGLLVFLHSVGGVEGFENPMAGTAAVFPARIGEAVAGLVANGVLERHPALKLLVSHAGGGLPASLARLEFVRGMAPAIDDLAPRPATEYAARLWFDHLAFDARVLRGLIDLVGADRVVFGSDYPFLHGDIVTLLEDPILPAGLSRSVRIDSPRRLIASLSPTTNPHTLAKEEATP